MPRIAYVNGLYRPLREAAVPVEDRGFQFADGVYEVIAIRQGRLADETGHLDRLDRSLGELQIRSPMPRRALRLVMRELLRRNRVRNGGLYMQVTRGVAPRDFRFPADSVATSLVMTVRPANLEPLDRLRTGVAVVSMPDIRWKRRDIKTVGLLPQVLGKQKAAAAGAFEGWMLDEEGRVTEGCSSNAWIVTRDGVLVTRNASNDILNGITRRTLLRLAGELGLALEERPFTLEEAFEAREAFLSSASTFCLPIVRIDDRPVGNGHPGLLAQKLREAYVAGVMAEPPIL
jgi:D-alanine transaminase